LLELLGKLLARRGAIDVEVAARRPVERRPLRHELRPLVREERAQVARQLALVVGDDRLGRGALGGGDEPELQQQAQLEVLLREPQRNARVRATPRHPISSRGPV